MKPIVVVPTYNEIENLERIAELILAQPGGFHIQIVDDSSPDGTGRVADDLSSRRPGEVLVLHRARKEGLGRAYVEGFERVLRKMPEYDAILQMDADLSHDPAALPEFLKLLEQHHLVLGSRYLHGVSVLNWDFKRLLLSKGAGVYVRTMTGMPYSDPTGGFKAWRREALNAIGLDRLFSNGYRFMTKTSLDKSKIKILLLEGIHSSAAEKLQADGYSNIECHPKALRREELETAAADAYFIGIRSATQLGRAFLSPQNDNVLFAQSRNVLLTSSRLGRWQKDNY